MSVSLKDKVVLVVGASSGIGQAIAKLFAEQGAKVMASARRENLLDSLKREMNNGPGHFETHAADAAKPAEIDLLVQRTESVFGRIEIMVFAVGTNTPDRAMSRLNPAIWNEMISVNLNAAYYATNAVLPSMRQAKDGHLIYISSIGGIFPDGSGAAYQAAKRGVLGLAHATRLEEKTNGIRTCVICPGMVDTALLERRPVKPTADDLRHALQPQDVAEIVLAVANLPARAVVPELQILPAYL